MFLTYTVEPIRLLPWLTRQFLDAGGELRKRKIHTLNELIDDGGYDLIINCTGLGARELAADNTVKCIRGQVARVGRKMIRAYIAVLNSFTYCMVQGAGTLGNARAFGRRRRWKLYNTKV